MATRGADLPKNVFCLETYSWYKGKDRTSVEPLLELLRRMGRCDYLHRDVATRSEFEYLLNDYLRNENKAYPILYLGFHGLDGPPRISFGNGEEINLDELADTIKGRCSNRVIFFGSCSIMNTHGKTLNYFVKKTKALAVCGYRKEVDWLQSAAFDTLILGTLQEVCFTEDGMDSFGQLLQERAKHLYKKTLDFRIVKSRQEDS